MIERERVFLLWKTTISKPVQARGGGGFRQNSLKMQGLVNSQTIEVYLLFHSPQLNEFPSEHSAVGPHL